MPDSDDDQSPAHAQLSGDDDDDDDDERVDREPEEETFEVDMDISDSPIQAHRRADRRADNEFEGRGRQFAPGSSNWGKSEARPPCNTFDMEESTSNSNFCGTSNEPLRLKSQKTFAGGGECRSQAFAENHARILSGKRTSTHCTQSHDDVKNVIKSEVEMKQVVQSTNDKNKMESRSAESNDPNKRLAIVCDFYTKGWCIRGGSCKFIHTKESPQHSHPQPEGDVAVASCSRDVKLDDEGKRDIPERPRLPGVHDPLASSSGNSFPFPSHLGIPSRHQFQSVHGEESNVGDSADVQKLHLAVDDLAFLTSYKDVGKDGHIRNRPADDLNNSPNKKGRYSTGNTTSHSSSMEDLAGVWIQRVHSAHTSPLVSHPLKNLSSNTLTTGLFPSSRISTWNGFSLPSYYSSLDANTLGSRKLLDSNWEYSGYTRSSAFLKSSSPFTSSDMGNFLPTSVSQHSVELKTKISSNNWEPSAPFQPSFILPPAFPSFSAKQYDPLCGSIELPKLANNSLEGETVGNKLHQKVLPETVSGTVPPACNADTKSMSSHNTYHEKVLDNSCYTRDPNSPVTEAETVGTSVVYQNGAMNKDKNPLGHSQVKGNTYPNKISIDSRQKSDGSSQQRDRKVDRFRENNGAEVEHLADGYVQQETKEMRQFRNPLIELVKDLLKPKWREGSLSKDAHNRIVKKAVDKIINAFQPEQIPPTIEAVAQYLTACRPKISKLVEGYIERYGKS